MVRKQYKPSGVTTAAPYSPYRLGHTLGRVLAHSEHTAMWLSDWPSSLRSWASLAAAGACTKDLSDATRCRSVTRRVFPARRTTLLASFLTRVYQPDLENGDKGA